MINPFKNCYTTCEILPYIFNSNMTKIPNTLNNTEFWIYEFTLVYKFLPFDKTNFFLFIYFYYMVENQRTIFWQCLDKFIMGINGKIVIQPFKIGFKFLTKPERCKNRWTPIFPCPSQPFTWGTHGVQSTIKSLLHLPSLQSHFC